MRVQNAGKAVFGRPNNERIVLNVSPNMIGLGNMLVKMRPGDQQRATYGVEHLLGEMNGNHDCNPVSSSGPGDILLVDSPFFQPLSDEVEALIIRPNEVINLVLRKVLAVPLVVRVADFHQVLFQDMELRLRERDSKTEYVVRRSR